ncbi:LITAF [Mytilus edulis]|uniref:LITAF n=1 Tax=Mytilus edulis TaxID=6550 RepID=A0A8S3Q9B5_MYTED|nr:LITAF [Mytilus edulis]
MSAFPAGYSDPSQYGSAFGPSMQPGPQASYPPPGPASYPPPAYPPPVMGQPMHGQMPMQTLTVNNQTITMQVDPAHAALVANMAQMLDPNNPARNEHPVRMKCPSCHQEVTTETTYIVGSCTYLCCILFFLSGLILCCWLAFFMNMAKDVVHTCPSCKAECGRFVRQQQNRVHASGGGRRRRGRRR